jgi:gamma-glutamylcyclotransferase (GGCT)/AIG2-like uncharacterized protein YtfP
MNSQLRCKLKGSPDVVTGWRLASIQIEDPTVVGLSGLAVHKILVPGRPGDEVDGVVFEITPEELKAADAYETDAYKRVKLKLRSGTETWVYVSSSAEA